MNFASPFWQAMLFLLAALFLLWEAWRGWRRGVIRSAIHLFAFAFSGLLGLLAGQATAFVVDKVFPGYGLLAGALVGASVTLLVLGLSLLLGALLFKRTEHQPSGLVRFFYGGGGAFFGLLTGLLLVWGGITIIRTFGVAAQMAMGTRSPEATPRIVKGILTLKESLELGTAGQAVESVDVLPASVYDLLARIGKLTSDQDAMMRFLDYPGVQEIMQTPRMTALLSDPVIVRAAEQKNFFALLGSRSLLEAAQDPVLQKKFTEFDLQKALDYAVPTPQPSPPSPKNP